MDPGRGGQRRHPPGPVTAPYQLVGIGMPSL